MSYTKVGYIIGKRSFSGMIALFLCFLVNVGIAQTGLGLRTVVIDPGHGGKDPGAVSPSDLYEKDVVLNVGMELGRMIKKEFPKVKVIYTRSTDVFVGLAERAAIANRAGADLFISLHCNAAGNTSATGLESWVLGLHKSAASLEVAKKENNAILMEDGHEQTYEDFNPNDPDAYIALAMRQNAFLDQSLALADLVQKNCIGDLKRKDRGVKQAGFVVLYRATMPSVLVELGFLSNKEEEKYLKSKTGQSELANELFDAFKQYKIQKENVDGIGIEPNVNNADQTEVKDSSIKVTPNIASDMGIVFKVQIATSTLNLPTKPENFKRMNDVEMKISGKYFKYYVGSYSTLEEARERQRLVREIGYDTAFIVAYENGEKISVKVASSRLTEK
ncbi:MAG: N-acetylmuramoyl-L-alanine amidase [Parvicella sp.]|jgi:N-acetylmuramoyl-L-alanine amidase